MKFYLMSGPPNTFQTVHLSPTQRPIRHKAILVILIIGDLTASIPSEEVGSNLKRCTYERKRMEYTKACYVSPLKIEFSG